MKKNVFAVISILVGAVFIFSGYSKLFPIEPFEFNFISIGVANWFTAPILSRGLISLEFTLGLSLIFQIKLQKFTLKAVAALLIFFTVYLIYQIIAEGNKGNCGCFGEMLKMTPLESISKNILLLILVGILFFFKHNIEWKFENWIFSLMIIVGITSTIALNPFDYEAASIMKDEITNLPLNTDTLYTSPKAFPHPAFQLNRGKQIICFLSLKCQHCADAAFKINIIKNELPEAPFYFVYGGVKENLNYFQQKIKYDGKIPFTLFEDEYFFKMCGGSYPGIYFTENGIIKRKSNIYTLNTDSIKIWLKK